VIASFVLFSQFSFLDTNRAACNNPCSGFAVRSCLNPVPLLGDFSRFFFDDGHNAFTAILVSRTTSLPQSRLVHPFLDGSQFHLRTAWLYGIDAVSRLLMCLASTEALLFLAVLRRVLDLRFCLSSYITAGLLRCVPMLRFYPLLLTLRTK
jgi:hypothetical protein